MKGQVICEPLEPVTWPLLADANGQVICEPLDRVTWPALPQPKRQVICEPLRFHALNARRAREGISIAAVIREARLHPKTWLQGQRGGKLRESTLEKIAGALDVLSAHSPLRRPPAAILGLVSACEQLLRAELVTGRGKANKALLKRINPRRGGAPVNVVLASRLHAIAIYLVAVELELANAEIARALGCERQNVRQVRNVIEDLREDAIVDALFVRVADKLKGGAG